MKCASIIFTKKNVFSSPIELAISSKKKEKMRSIVLSQYNLNHCLILRQHATLQVSADHAARHVAVDAHMPVQVAGLGESEGRTYMQWLVSHNG